MKRINILSSKTAQLIAAGEITENPASVVKELLENSIDAGSTRITIEIKNGGTKFIKVSDNGHGIYREDVQTAFMRHATSKIKYPTEISKIASLGFRGEALASIASVSNVDLLTRSKEESLGTHVNIYGGDFGDIQDAGCAEGTIISVKDLFYNTPARMKFLKKDIAEGNKVASVIDKISLSHPEVFFKFIRDGKISLCTPGDGKISSAIYSIYGKEFFDGMIRVEYQLGNVKVKGYISKPEKGRATKSMQLFFVNGRFIKNSLNSSALEEAFKNSIMVNKNPYCVIHLTVPFDMVDVNVHPSKNEIKYANEKEVFEAIYHAVKTTLINFNKQSFKSLEIKSIPDPITNKNKKFKQLTLKDSNFCFDTNKNLSSQWLPQNAFKPLPKKVIDSFKIIGEIFGCYLVIQCKSKLVLIDKHAAHERIIFEKLKSQSRKYDSQLLLKPVVLNLEKQEYNSIVENLDLFSRSGYDIESFGPGALIIRSAPMYEDFDDLADSVTEIAHYIMKNKKHPETKKLEWIYQNIACRSAIKSKSKTSPEEISKLVLEMINNPSLKYCPHGRPIYIEFEKKFIEKRFGRK